MHLSKVILRTVISIILALLPAGQLQAPVAASSISVKNIIIMIGDGMGYNHALAASYYHQMDNTSIAWVIFKVLGYEYFTWLPIISKRSK